MASITPESTAAPPAPTEFKLFPKLPLELRLKIFRHALPVGPRGIRVLKVAADKLVTMLSTSIETNTKKARRSGSFRATKYEAGSCLSFRVLEHEHSIFVKDLSLLSTCSDSRRVYLKYFTSTLNAAGDGLIRFAMQDIVYIANFDVLLKLPEMMIILANNKTFDGIRCRNLALPTLCFDMKHVESWNPDWNEYFMLSGQYIKFCNNCEELEVVGAMLDDMESVLDDTQFKVWRRNKSLWRQDTEVNLELVRLNWTDSKKVCDKKWTLLELGLWDHEGSRLKLKRDARENPKLLIQT